MKHGDIRFHELTRPVIDSIAGEGLRIAKENDWAGLIIEIEISQNRPSTGLANPRCTLRNAACVTEVDEPSAVMVDTVRRLQELFMSVGTPLTGVTIDWIPSAENKSRVRRRCSYRYD